MLYWTIDCTLENASFICFISSRILRTMICCGMVTVDFVLPCIDTHRLQVRSYPFPFTISVSREFANFRMIAVESERVDSQLSCIPIDNVLIKLSERLRLSNR